MSARDAGASRSLLGRIGTVLREDAVWAVCDLLFTDVAGSKWLPRPLRMAILNLAGAHLEAPPGMRFVLAGRARNLTVGRDTYMNQQVFIEAIAPVRIGEACALGMQAAVLTSHHPIDASGRWQERASGRTVSIGDRVWIGARATILPGAVIESDVVVAAGAVVTGRCRSGGIYAGVPAKRIRELTTEDIQS